MPLPARASDKPLNPEIERLLYQEKVIVQEAEGLYHGLSGAQLTWSPGADQWSLAQCLDHLNITNRNMIQALEPAIRNGRAEGKLSDGPFVYGFLSRWFHRQLQPPVKTKFKAPPNFQPGPPKTLGELEAEWKKSHERIEELLRDASGLDLVRIKVQSPASKWIRYGLGMAFWIQTAHDKRHLWQMRQVRNLPNFPKA